MKVRHLFVASLLLTVAAHAAEQAPATGPAPDAKPLEFNDCMRTDRITDWKVVDDRTLLVATGPDRFVVKTNVDCPRMGLGGGVRFKTAESNKAVGAFRICGTPTEKVERIHDDPPCNIASVSKIDKATYTTMSKKAKLSGSGAGINGSKP
ncbi:hypothetical protein ACVWWJ_003237 [Luteibacter sp. HA06]